MVSHGQSVRNNETHVQDSPAFFYFLFASAGPSLRTGKSVRWAASGFQNDMTIHSPSGTASSNLANGGAFGIFGGERYDITTYSGEARYLYVISDSASLRQYLDGYIFRRTRSFLQGRISSSSSAPSNQGSAIYRIRRRLELSERDRSRIRRAAFEVIRSALTATRQTLPTATVRLGVKIELPPSSSVLRFEADDYISSTPSKVIAPAPGNSVSGWMKQRDRFRRI